MLRSPSILSSLLLGLCVSSFGAPQARSAEAIEPFPDMATTVGDLVQDQYYDRTRFQPHVMVERALRALASSEIPLLANWHDGHITVRIKDATTELPAPEPLTVHEAMALIESVRGVIDASDYPEARKRDFAYALVNGALASLDPHTRLIPPEPAKRFSEDLSGEFFGIGAILTQKDSVIAIERVLPGLPAERSGVEDDDHILAVDGEKTTGLTLDQAVRRIRGPKGTQVTLTLERKGKPSPVQLVITRDMVTSVTMRHYRSGDIGYVTFTDFNQNTARDLATNLLDMQKQGNLRGLVIDLRGNPGGLLDQAKIMCEFFLSRGQELVRTVTGSGGTEIYRSNSRQVFAVPLLVLVSRGSASAAEIVSGALQRNDRAVVMGTTTYGKGSVQTIRPLRDDSRFKITIQEYQLPGGVSIQDVGVTPDVALVRHTLRKDGTLDRMLPYSFEREEDDEFALLNRASYEHSSIFEMGWVAPWQTRDERRRSAVTAREFVPDHEAMLGIDLLTAATDGADFPAKWDDAVKNGKMRQLLLERLKKPLEARAEQESTHLSEALAKQKPAIIWGEAGTITPGSLSLAFTGPSSVTAGSGTVDLGFTVTNNGPTAVGRLHGVVQTDRFSPLWEDEVVFGTVAPGATVNGVLHFAVPPRLFSGSERFTLDVRQGVTETNLASLPVSLQIVAQNRPHLDLTWKLEDPAVLTPGGEPVPLSLVVTNSGTAPASRVMALAFKSDDPFVQISETRFPKDGKKAVDLAPGATFTFQTLVSIVKTIRNQDYTNSKVSIQFTCQETFEDGDDDDTFIDGRFRSGIATTIDIPVGSKQEARTIRTPKLTLSSIENSDGNHSTLVVGLDDENAKFLTVFQNDDKIDLRTVGDTRSFRIPVTLKPGLNEVRVIVSDADDVQQALPIRLWGDGTPEARKNKIVRKAAVSASPNTEVP